MSLFGPKRIYLDYASAPPVRKEALSSMAKADRYIGNPGAIHAEGAEALAALEGARERVAAQLNVKAREVIFTSGLTESNNLAIVGAARSLERRTRAVAGTHWVVSSIEHSSVLDCFGEIERLGGTVQHLMPDSRGRITPESVRAILRPDTVFVSVGWANNELGTIQPLAHIRSVISEHESAHKRTVLLHSDAGQAPLYLASTVRSLGVDLLSIGSNKLYGPHGIGALYMSRRAEVARVAHGGPQERRLRPGTESVALAVGFATAYDLASRERSEEAARVRTLRDWLARELARAIPGLIINGDPEEALPHMLNISVPGIQSEYVTLALDRVGIAVSTKSACREGEKGESHVVAALDGDAHEGGWRARNTIRLSLGRETSQRDVKEACRALVAIVNKRAS